MERQEVGLPLGESQGSKPGAKESPLQLYIKKKKSICIGLDIFIGFVNIAVVLDL